MSVFLLQNPRILLPEVILDDIDVFHHNPSFLFPLSFLFHLRFRQGLLLSLFRS